MGVEAGSPELQPAATTIRATTAHIHARGGVIVGNICLADSSTEVADVAVPLRLM